MSALITCSHVDFGYENQDAVMDLTLEELSQKLRLLSYTKG